jgi:hypothetical protein
VGPYALAALQKVDDELVLGPEVPVERHLGRTGPGDDGTDTDGLRAVPAEQLIGGAPDAFPAARQVAAPVVLPVGHAAECSHG